jgi:multiple sugar transport system permease protein
MVAAVRRWLVPASFMAPALVVLVAVNVLPVVVTALASFEDYYLPRASARAFVGAANYAELLADGRFWNAFRITVVFVSVSLALEVGLGLAIALMLARQRYCVGLLRGLIFLPVIITPIAIAFVWRLMFSPTIGLLNFLLPIAGLPPLEWIYSPEQALPSLIVVEVWQHTPELTLIIFTGLIVLPKELIESARVDGASSLQLLTAIKLPLLKPILMVGVLFRVVDLFKTFDLFYILTRGGPGVATESLVVYVYTVGFGFLRLGYASALAVVLFLAILVVSFLIFRWGEVRLG